MGLIKALTGAVGGTFADQWKEFFYCDALDSDVLVTKGAIKTSGRSSNKSGNENIITNGSQIAVADGQCMMIVEQGKIVEICAEPGAFTYDASTEPSIFSGDLGESINELFKEIGKRFTFGGDTAKDQRIYYFNTKEIMGNKYGTATPVPFRVVDRNIGLDIDISIRCNGEYSYKITNPMLFYTNVCGNISEEYTRDNIDSMLKAELMNAIQPSFAKISAMGIRYSALPGYTMELSSALNEVLSKIWKEKRGIEVASFNVNSVSASKEDENMIKEMQRNAVLRDPGMMAATIAGAQAQAMQDAANNTGGAMMGFAGLNMAQGSGGVNPQNLLQMTQQNKVALQSGTDNWKCTCGASSRGKFCMQCGGRKPIDENNWKCSCGAENSGKFCMECGSQKADKSWQCACGTENNGKFCMECGKVKSTSLSYRCNKCGYEPENPAEPPKFCVECGDIFDENDKK